MTSDTRQRVMLPERNNTFKKIIIDTYRDEYAIVAETEDLIVEYCVREKAITNLCAEEREPENQYCKMRKQHLRDWPDNTSRIREEGLLEDVKEFQEQLAQVKLKQLDSVRRGCRRCKTFSSWVFLLLLLLSFVDCHITALLKIK